MVIEKDGVEEKILVSSLISSAPISEVFNMIKPDLEKAFIDVAKNLHYRDFITVALIINKQSLFEDNWIYIHDPDVLVGRIQNFNNWSEYMVPNNKTTCIEWNTFVLTLI